VEVLLFYLILLGYKIKSPLIQVSTEKKNKKKRYLFRFELAIITTKDLLIPPQVL
jgi:hypothetical protein